MEKGYIMCRGRHPAPPPKVCRRYHINPRDSLFPKWLEPFDYQKMDNYLEDKLYGVDRLNVVVTGLSTALLQTCGYCARNGIRVTFLHYDQKTKKYKVQRLEETPVKLD